MTDWELIQAYAHQRSEDAFTQLMQRYVDLVHSSAFRQVRSADLAQDVTQAVFLLLGRKAGQFRPGTVLAGWLFRTTRFVAARATRAEQRRKRREEESVRMSTPTPQTDSDAPTWDQVEPWLDEAIASLPETDQQALLLRFLARKPFREVGQELGLEEEATKKRVSRAIEKLRVFFRKKGVVMTTTALSAGLAESAVQAAPPNLIPQTIAVRNMGASSASTAFALLEAVQRSTFYAKLRLALGWGLVIVLFLGVTRFVPRRSQDPGGGVVPAEPATQAAPANREPTPPPPRRAASQATRFSLTVLAAEDATPLAGARLLVDWCKGEQSNRLPVFQADTRGVVEFSVPRLPFDVLRLRVSADRCVPKLIEWYPYELSQGTNAYTVRLARGTQLSGSVRDEGGTLVTGATVSFSGPGMNMAERENAHFNRDLSAVISDEQGRWTMNQMPAGQELHIAASHPDYATTEIGTWNAPGRPTNIVLVLTNGFSVYGQVISAGGQPVPGALVCKESGASQCTKTDEEGRFMWPRVEAGRAWVNVRANGFNELNQSIQVTNGPNDVVLKVTGTPRLGSSRAPERESVRLVGSVRDAETEQPIILFKVLTGSTMDKNSISDGTPLVNGRFVGEGHNGQIDWELNGSELRPRPFRDSHSG